MVSSWTRLDLPSVLGGKGREKEKKKRRKKKGTKIEEVVGYEMEKRKKKEIRKKGGKISGRRVKRPIVESIKGDEWMVGKKEILCYRVVGIYKEYIRKK